MLTISALARRFRLSRSTLLYYDRIGLLRPSGRSRAGYRQYRPEDAERLEQICTYRRAGVPLQDIPRLLGGPGDQARALLEAHLRRLEEDIQHLRHQQRAVAALLQDPGLLEALPGMDKATWVGLLRASGFSDADMDRWHEAFERNDPDRHQRFLAFLGLDAEAIAAVRARSR